MIYVIPYNIVKPRVELVSYERRALPLSNEYLIADLHTDEFDIIDLEREIIL